MAKLIKDLQEQVKQQKTYIDSLEKEVERLGGSPSAVRSEAGGSGIVHRLSRTHSALVNTYLSADGSIEGIEGLTVQESEEIMAREQKLKVENEELTTELETLQGKAMDNQNQVRDLMDSSRDDLAKIAAHETKIEALQKELETCQNEQGALAAEAEVATAEAAGLKNSLDQEVAAREERNTITESQNLRIEEFKNQLHKKREQVENSRKEATGSKKSLVEAHAELEKLSVKSTADDEYRASLEAELDEWPLKYREWSVEKEKFKSEAVEGSHLLEELRVQLQRAQEGGSQPRLRSYRTRMLRIVPNSKTHRARMNSWEARTNQLLARGAQKANRGAPGDE